MMIMMMMMGRIRRSRLIDVMMMIMMMIMIMRRRIYWYVWRLRFICWELKSVDNDLIDLRFLRTPSTGSDCLDPYISPTKKNHFKRLQSFNICNRYNWISCFRPDSVQDWWTTHCPTWLGWSWTGVRIHLWMRHQAFQCCACLWMKMMLLKLWKNLQVGVHLDTLYECDQKRTKTRGPIYI